MYTEKSNIEIIKNDNEIHVVGLNLQSSGLPITWDSLGKMWERYTEEIKVKTPNLKSNQVEYGICINKVPDYLVGLEVVKVDANLQDYFTYTIPKGEYVKVSFNAENHEELVGKKLMEKEKEAKKWARTNKVKINGVFTVEVYPNESTSKEYPEMYCLFPVNK